MPEDTATTGDTPALSPELEALMPSGTEIYDALMGPIEEELLSANLATLEDNYTDESEEDKAQRLDRYNKAFAAYDEAYSKWITGLKGAVKEERHDAYKAAEEKVNQEDEAALTDLESQFEKTKPSSSQ